VAIPKKKKAANKKKGAKMGKMKKGRR